MNQYDTNWFIMMWFTCLCVGIITWSLGWSQGMRQGRYYGIKQARSSEQRRPVKRRLRGLQEHFKRFLVAREKIQNRD